MIQSVHPRALCDMTGARMNARRGSLAGSSPINEVAAFALGRSRAERTQAQNRSFVADGGLRARIPEGRAPRPHNCY